MQSELKTEADDEISSSTSRARPRGGSLHSELGGGFGPRALAAHTSRDAPVSFLRKGLPSLSCSTERKYN